MNEQDLLKYFTDKKASLVSEQDDLKLQIKENNFLLDGFVKKTENSSFIFSPRIGDDSLDKIDILKNQITTDSEKLDALEKEITSVDQFISTVQSLIHRDTEFKEEMKSVRNNGLDIISLQENDRKRISRDLHDTSLQNLTYLIHKLELCNLFIDQDPLRAKLEIMEVRKNLQSVIDEIRKTIYDLRPMSFDDLGFCETVEHMINSVNHDKKIFVDYHIENVSCENTVLINIYRIIQEAFANIIKHSGASKAIISLEKKNEKYYLHIEDNGRGFSLEDIETLGENHFGLDLMKERVALINGTYSIDSKTDCGTKLDIIF